MNLKSPDPKINLSLKKIKTFLNFLGKPQNRIKFIIHIAGTNGKGSTLAFLEALLNQNDLKIGKYTSPHLINIQERFIINQEKISEQEFNLLWQKLSQIKYFDNLTYFEKLTALGFVYFAEKQVDILLLETGLGGRLDATNIIQNTNLCLITNIGLDHQEYLGNTLEKITTEKAGILKKNSYFFMGIQEENLQNIVLKIAQKKQANFLNLNPEILNKIQNLKLGLAGEYQYKNANLALNAYFYLANNFKNFNLNTNWDFVQNKICNNITWKGRFELIKYKNNRSFLIDGAHNISGAEALRQNLQNNNQEIWLLGFLKNKDYKNILEKLFLKNKSQIKYIILTYSSSPELSADLNILQNILLQIGLKPNQIILQESTDKAFYNFLELINNNLNTLGIISGSLYLLGQILEFCENNK